MNYVRRTWKNGETITADKLNNIEQGITEAKTAAERAENKAMTPEAVKALINEQLGVIENGSY